LTKVTDFKQIVVADGSAYVGFNVMYHKGMHFTKQIAVLGHVDAKDDGSRFLRKFDHYLPIHKASYPSRLELSFNINCDV
jgi:hypothetical protein